MNRDPERKAGRRRAYDKPVLRRVRLVPDEAVLASCKNNTTAGPAGPISKCAVAASCFHNAS